MNRNLFIRSWMSVAGLLGCCIRAENLQVSSESHPDWAELSTKNYSLKHPKGMLVDRSGMMGSEFVIFLKNPVLPNEFNPNINLQIQDLQGKKVSLDQFTEISLDQVNQFISNSKVIASSRRKGAKGEYQVLMYTGDQGVYRLQFEQFFAIANGKAHILTLTCEQPSFEQYRSLGEGIMNTFVLK